MKCDLLGIRLQLTLLTVIVVAVPAAVCRGDDGEAGTSSEPVIATDPAQVFEDRIMPIFRSPKPSSCVQCHLSSVDIKDYILPSHTETFLALRDQGLVNLDDPAKSKILQLIQMGEEDADPLAKRLHAKARQAEYEAFAAWIKACCSDPSLRTQQPQHELASVGPDKPLEVVRHSRKSRVLDAFTRNIWSQRMRCFPCHTPHEFDSQNPRHAKAKENYQNMVKTHGAKMNLFDRTPEATMRNWVANSRSRKDGVYPLINLQDATKSLIVLKPTSKVPAKQDDGTFEKPSSVDPVSHMGGLKMHMHDHSYKAFIAWIDDYSAIAGQRYLTADELPQDDWIPTQRILRVKQVPESWGTGKVVQLTVHAQQDNGWSSAPIAFTQGTVTPRGFVNGALFLLGQPDKDALPLPAGRYLVKAYVDKNEVLAEDPTAMLNADAYVGQATVDALWQEGFPKAETVEGAAFGG